MRTFHALLVALAPVVLLTPACTPTQCEPESQPLRGRAETPEGLFRIIQHSGRNGCDDVLFEMMSAKTRDEIPGWKFRNFWDSDQAIVFPPEPVPEDAPDVYTLAEVVKGAEFDTDDEESPRHVKVTYERPREPGKPRHTNVRFHLLVVPEKTEDGRTEWRLGMWEQLHAGVAGVGGPAIGEVTTYR